MKLYNFLKNSTETLSLIFGKNLDKKLKMNAILKIKSTSSKGNKHFPKAKKWSYFEEL